MRGTLGEMERILTQARPDVVLVTIPDAPDARLDEVRTACRSAGVECHFVRREIRVDEGVVVGATTE